MGYRKRKENVERMRLVDADALIEKLKRASIFEKITNAEDKNVFEIIDEQPTAYDIEKVVAELEEVKANAFDDEVVIMNDAIEIVRKGGMK